MSIVARSKYLKGLDAALELELRRTRETIEGLSAQVLRNRQDMDAAKRAADESERRWEESRRALLDAYSHVGFIHAKMGVVDAQLASVGPEAAKMESALARTESARAIGRSLKGEPDRACHYAAVTVYESMDPENRPSLSAVQGRVRQAVHGFSIITPDPEDYDGQEDHCP